jgi:hypothetical protein
VLCGPLSSLIGKNKKQYYEKKTFKYPTSFNFNHSKSRANQSDSKNISHEPPKKTKKNKYKTNQRAHTPYSITKSTCSKKCKNTKVTQTKTKQM